MADVTEQRYQNLAGYDNESMKALADLWDEAKRRRAAHEAIGAELEQLENFVSIERNRHLLPQTVAAVERVIAAFRAAEIE